MNGAKTEFLSTNSFSKVEVEECEFEALDYFKHLGLIIQANGSLDRETDKRIVEGIKVISKMNSVLQNINIIVSIKWKIYNIIFQSIILYGSKTWILKKRQKERLMATQMDFCRRSTGKSRLEKICNETIRETMNVKKNIIQMIEEKQLGLFGHVMHIGHERLPNH